jgi:cyclic pyranopterin phosphate synthase
MPREIFGADYRFLQHSELLTFEEITRLARLFVGLGVEKIRLTGGEPLLRRGIENLIEMLVQIPGLHDLALTTNGSLLAQRAKDLRSAGLHRLNISLDSLDPQTFARMSDTEIPVSRVLDGIEAAKSAGFRPIKINAVIKRGVNHEDIVALAQRFSGPEYIVRLIEYMDVGSSNGWRMDDVVPAAEMLTRLQCALPLEPLPPNYPGEVAKRFRNTETGGEIGLVTSITQPFCTGCTRARLSSVGQLYTCLFSATGFDLREMLRSGQDDAAISNAIAKSWTGRADRYSEIRTAETARQQKVEMSYIGG